MLSLTVKQNNCKKFSFFFPLFFFLCVCVCVCVYVCVHAPVFMENFPLMKRAWLFILFY